MLYYKTINTEEDVFQKAYDLGLALLLKGPTGCGKSRFVEHMAEKLQHHPSITFTYGRVDIQIYTHAIDGLSQNDFILAQNIDTL